MVQSLMVSVMPHFEDREVSVFDLYYPWLLICWGLGLRAGN
jgi:hypothetical protein